MKRSGTRVGAFFCVGVVGVVVVAAVVVVVVAAATIFS